MKAIPTLNNLIITKGNIWRKTAYYIFPIIKLVSVGESIYKSYWYMYMNAISL